MDVGRDGPGGRPVPFWVLGIESMKSVGSDDSPGWKPGSGGISSRQDAARTAERKGVADNGGGRDARTTRPRVSVVTAPGGPRSAPTG